MTISKLNKIAEYIIKNILINKWKSNEKIPSIQFLEIKFGVSKNTIKKTLNKLIQANILYSKEKVGYFVQSKQLQTIIQRESKIDGCNSYVVIENQVEKYFDLEDMINNLNAKNAKWSLMNCIFPKKYFSFTKLYFKKNKSDVIRKVSFSYINEELIKKENYDQKAPLYINLINNDAFPMEKIVNTYFEKKVPINIAKTLDINKNEGAIIRNLVLIDDKKRIIHAAKIYIKISFFKIDLRTKII